MGLQGRPTDRPAGQSVIHSVSPSVSPSSPRAKNSGKSLAHTRTHNRDAKSGGTATTPPRRRCRRTIDHQRMEELKPQTTVIPTVCPGRRICPGCVFPALTIRQTASPASVATSVKCTFARSHRDHKPYAFDSGGVSNPLAALGHAHTQALFSRGKSDAPARHTAVVSYPPLARTWRTTRTCSSGVVVFLFVFLGQRSFYKGFGQMTISLGPPCAIEL